MSGTLYLCATPIGNLEDISFRAIRILKESDIIAAEDTRHTLKLLNHYEIKTPLTSYHEHNKESKGKILVQKLREGKNIALVTDAGMPGISDPGSDMVRLCHKEGINVTVIPGATAFAGAVVLSGMDTSKFTFIGFLPQETNKAKQVLENVRLWQTTLIFYEAPHRIIKTLKLMLEILGDRNISAISELTKKYEKINRMLISEAVQYYEHTPPKGEYVLVAEGIDQESLDEERMKKWEGISVKDHVEMYMNQGMDKKEAMKKTAKDRNVSKREIYSELL